MTATLQVGLIIDQKYELLRLLGSGSMGAVWLAKEDGREVAIKFVLDAAPHFRERFLAEIKALISLRSHYIVNVYNSGQIDGLPYMVMERLEGSDLAEMLIQLAPKPLERTRAVDFIVQAAAGLAAAHAKGIVHRDLKPANLFFDGGTQSIKVVDFGIAGAGQVRGPLTVAGAYMGTPNYSAPEQFAGADVGPAADIWALGAVLYELLSARMAFPGESNALTQAPVPLPLPLAGLQPDLPIGLVRAVERCLQRQPSQRYDSALAFIRAVAPFGTSRSEAVRDSLGGGDSASPEELAATVPPDSEQADNGSDPPNAITDPPSSEQSFSTEDGLLQVLLDNPTGSKKEKRPIVFMLGAGFSRPVTGRDGVPATDGIVQRVESRLKPEQRKRLQARLRVSKNKYQDAFKFIHDNKDRDEANTVIRQAVLEAYRGPGKLPDDPDEQERACASFESRGDDWQMPPGVEHLGRIVAEGLKRPHPVLTRFSKIHLTTNFDPLLHIAIHRNGAQCESQAVETDYDIPRAENYRCLLVHLHGRWREGKTLHNDLGTPRPLLQSSLRSLLANSVLVVLGYGGWTDVFMQTLAESAKGEQSFDILWGFYDKAEGVRQHQAQLLAKLVPLGKQVRLYAEVDTNRLFERLEAALLGFDEPAPWWKSTKVRAVAGAALALGALSLVPWPQDDDTLVAQAGAAGAPQPGAGASGGGQSNGGLPNDTVKPVDTGGGGGGGAGRGGEGGTVGRREPKPPGTAGRGHVGGGGTASGGSAGSGGAAGTAGATNVKTAEECKACKTTLDQALAVARTKAGLQPDFEKAAQTDYAACRVGCPK